MIVMLLTFSDLSRIIGFLRFRVRRRGSSERCRWNQRQYPKRFDRSTFPAHKFRTAHFCRIAPHGRICADMEREELRVMSRLLLSVGLGVFLTGWLSGADWNLYLQDPSGASGFRRMAGTEA